MKNNDLKYIYSVRCKTMPWKNEHVCRCVSLMEKNVTNVYHNCLPFRGRGRGDPAIPGQSFSLLGTDLRRQWPSFHDVKTLKFDSGRSRLQYNAVRVFGGTRVGSTRSFLLIDSADGTQSVLCTYLPRYRSTTSCCLFLFFKIRRKIVYVIICKYVFCHF